MVTLKNDKKEGKKLSSLRRCRCVNTSGWTESHSESSTWFGEMLKLMMWQQGHSPHTAPHTQPVSHAHTHQCYKNHLNVFASAKVIPASASSICVFLEVCKMPPPPSLYTKVLKTFDSISGFKVSVALNPPGNIIENVLLASAHCSCD